MAPGTVERLWMLLGTAGAIIFFGRFYVQWIYSEIKKRSAMPVAFWYMSVVGCVSLFTHAVHIKSPGMAFGQCFNLIVYARNLFHIWRERGWLTKGRSIALHAAVAAFVAVAVVMTAATWFWEYKANMAPGVNAHEAARNWFWLGVWGLGQALFSCRFLVQWIATEQKRKSVVPTAFWHISIVATVLQMSSFLQRHELIYAAGNAATLLVYVRNLWLIYSNPSPSDTAGAE